MRRLFRVLHVLPESDVNDGLVILEDCRSEDSVGWRVAEMAIIGLRVVVPSPSA